MQILKSKEVYKKYAIGIISTSLGDFICQQIEKSSDKNKKFNKKRFIIQSSWGILITPYFMGIYFLLEKFCKVVNLITLLKTIFFLQFISSPFSYFLYFMFSEISHGKGYKTGLNTYRSRIKDILISNGKFWPFVNSVNFYFIPYSFRIHFSMSASLVWNIYLSYFKYVLKA